MALSSITKKLIMSISGLFLIVFLLLHMTINFFSVIDTFTGKYGAADGLFQIGCDFMALPIVTIMVPVLAAGFLVHIIYAFILSYGNYKARGSQRYAVANKTKAESWAAKNMLIIGVIVLGILAFHLNHFWADMQLAEWKGITLHTGKDHCQIYVINYLDLNCYESETDDHINQWIFMKERM